MRFVRLFFILLFSCITSYSIGQDSDMTIYFKTTKIENSRFIWLGGTNITATISMLTPCENITGYPNNFKILQEHVMNLQVNQYYFYLANKSKDDYDKVIKVFGSEWYDKVSKLKYSKKYVDCLLTFCILEDSTGNIYIVFDSNNDEDLSNDEILTFKSEKINFGTKVVELERVQVTIHTDYYDGNKIISDTFPVGLSRRFSNKINNYSYSLTLLIMNEGKLSVNNTEYTVGLINGNDLEYSKHNSIWVDSNQNGTFDPEDVFSQLTTPFTIFGQTYELKNIGRFGKSIDIIKCDLKVVPTISKGMTAPDFEAITLDSTRFKLSDLKGKYVLLDFWGTWCGPCVAEVQYLKDAYDKFKSSDFDMVSIGIDDPKRLKAFIQKNDMKWIHIQQNKNSDLEELYQVSSYPSKFLIDKEGIIISQTGESDDLYGDKLLTTLKRLIK